MSLKDENLWWKQKGSVDVKKGWSIAITKGRFAMNNVIPIRLNSAGYHWLNNNTILEYSTQA